jgi:hypothetical protein
MSSRESIMWWTARVASASGLLDGAVDAGRQRLVVIASDRHGRVTAHEVDDLARVGSVGDEIATDQEAGRGSRLSLLAWCALPWGFDER